MYYICNPLLNKNFLNFDSLLSNDFLATANKNVLDMVMAVSIEIKTPIPKVRAKPLIAEVPSQKRMMAVMIEEMFESRIESHALEKPSCKAS